MIFNRKILKQQKCAVDRILFSFLRVVVTISKMAARHSVDEPATVMTEKSGVTVGRELMYETSLPLLAFVAKLSVQGFSETL